MGMATGNHERHRLQDLATALDSFSRVEMVNKPVRALAREAIHW
jgi:hypothetical protein